MCISSILKQMAEGNKKKNSFSVGALRVLFNYLELLRKTYYITTDSRRGGKIMNLYEIEAEMLTCISEDGEVIDLEKLDALTMERNSKVSNIACWIKDLKAEAEAIKAEKQNLDKRQKVAENKAASLREYLAGFLNGEKYKDARVSISYRKSTAVQIDEDMDIKRLPEEYLKVTVEPSKTAIKEALTNGVAVEGCTLIENNNIQIR